MKIDLTLLKRIHESISSGSTGCPDCMARKLDISRRLLLNILKQMKEEFNAPIMYSRPRETYYYTEDCEFYFGIVKSRRLVLTQTILNAINKAALEAISQTILCGVLIVFVVRLSDFCT